MNKHLPSINNAITKTFDLIDYGLKVMQPVFSKFNGIFEYLSKNLKPELVNYSPGLKTFFEGVIVPSCSLAADAIMGVFKAIDLTYNIGKNIFNFLKDNWVPFTIIASGIIGSVLLPNINAIKWNLVTLGIEALHSFKMFYLGLKSYMLNTVAWNAIGLFADKTRLKMMLIGGVWGLVISAIK